MTPNCKTTDRDLVLDIRETTAESPTEVRGGQDRPVYDRLHEILHYDVRSIGDPDQAWFWTEEWQARERAADADKAAGRSTAFRSGDDLLAHLDALEDE